MAEVLFDQAPVISQTLHLNSPTVYLFSFFSLFYSKSYFIILYFHFPLYFFSPIKTNEQTENNPLALLSLESSPRRHRVHWCSHILWLNYLTAHNNRANAKHSVQKRRKYAKHLVRLKKKKCIKLGANG